MRTLDLDLVPLGENYGGKDDLQLEKLAPYSPGHCFAHLFRNAEEWDDDSLEIKWDSATKEFNVVFTGVGHVDIRLENGLSRRVPLEVAQSSRCECGGTLALGDFRIHSGRKDFTFEGNYFCPTCKADYSAKHSGIRHMISKWANGLKKIEIKPSGVGFERE
jgi:hypothetical protein